MHDDRSYLRQLFNKLISDQCSEEEFGELLELIRSLPSDDPLMEELGRYWDAVYSKPNKLDAAIGRRIHQDILYRIGESGSVAQSLESYPAVPEPGRSVMMPVGGHRRKSINRWWAAAAVFLLIIAGVYLFVSDAKRAGDLGEPQETVSAGIEPGKEGAILTLADGTVLVLDTLGSGVLATQQNTQLILHDGQLIYQAPENWSGEVLYNSMSTPKGRQFQLELPDGTRVWLNAQSSIRYPTVFTGSERVVEISGEVYFEVVKYKRLPFKVKVSDQAEIDVLGTHFNVKAYANDEGLNTTLIEGSVKVSSLSKQGAPGFPKTVVLRPNEQAFIHPSYGSIQTGLADIEKVMAWKNGYFSFEGLSFAEIMRQLERWYDINVVFEGEMPDIQFFGKMSKNVQLNDLLEGLQASGVQFRIESGRRLIVNR